MEKQSIWFYSHFQFFRLPKTLFSDARYKNVSPLAKLLYAFLLDRLCLSASNGKAWIDKDGEIFVFFTIKELSQRCCCGHDKASRLLKELEQANLIRRVTQGQGRPNKIFVLPFVLDNSGVPPSGQQQSSALKTRRHERYKSDANNTYVNNLFNNTEMSLGWIQDIRRFLENEE